MYDYFQMTLKRKTKMAKQHLVKKISIKKLYPDTGVSISDSVLLVRFDVQLVNCGNQQFIFLLFEWVV